MKVVIAPDSYKGGPTARRVTEVIAAGWCAARPEDTVVDVPLADGGEGTLEALDVGITGSVRHGVQAAVGPDGRPVDTECLLLPDGTAVVEMAAVSGLPLMAALDPLGATSRGVGQVIGAALDAGATRLVLGVGGSASTDGGTGALAALGARFLDGQGEPLPDGGGALHRLAAVDLTDLRPPPVRGVEILTDVDVPLLGPRGSAAVFGPQKGADAQHVEELESGLRVLAQHLGGDPNRPGAGAAGGIAYGFATVWAAELRPGCRAIASELSLADEVRDADLVITGEGCLDRTSLRGKVVSVVLELAEEAGTEVAIVAGAVTTAEGLADRATIVNLTELAGSPQRSMATPERFLEEAGGLLARRWSDRGR